MPFEFTIVTGGSTPIYKQIVDQVRLAIATGALKAGQQVPSVRAVAERLVVNPNTVARAYADLVREGLLDTQPGKGLYVAERRQRYSDQERMRLLTKAVDDFVQEVLLLDFSRDEILAILKERLAAMETASDSRKEEPTHV